jgi:hypothetical protein
MSLTSIKAGFISARASWHGSNSVAEFRLGQIPASGPQNAMTGWQCGLPPPKFFAVPAFLFPYQNSEDAVRRGLAKFDEAARRAWLQTHLDNCIRPLLSEPWVLDVDSTVKPLYGQREGAAFGYNPQKPGRPSHSYHTYIVSSLRLVLRGDVLPGDEHNVAHATGGLWRLLDHLGGHRWPSLLRGDKSWGVQPVMAEAAACHIYSASG